MKIYIAKEEDRMTVGALLLKNGYRVSQGAEIKPGTKTTKLYFLEATRSGGEAKNEG